MDETLQRLRCPHCGQMGLIDDDQFHGRAPITCFDAECAYTHRRNWSKVEPFELTWPRDE